MHRIAYSIAEAVRVSGVSRSSIYLALKHGSLAAFKIGRRTFISDEALRDWIESMPKFGASRSADKT